MIKVIGLGPGSSSHQTPEAKDALLWADVIVGYKTYIDLITPDLLQDKEILSTGMKREIDRCEAAINEALKGRKTVIVSSGDPGIYGMAGLVLELVHNRGLDNRLDVEIVPGIPALCAAAALLGAPLMHDFAVISLSDLLTPWELIKKRLLAALRADFVIVIYNPRSKKRVSQFHEVMELVIDKRGKDTPVGVVKNASRPGETVSATVAERVDETDIDMLTILVIGNSSTKITGNRMITPRGYMEKYRS